MSTVEHTLKQRIITDDLAATLGLDLSFERAHQLSQLVAVPDGDRVRLETRFALPPVK